MASFQWSAISYTFKWIAVGDHRTCNKCLTLNGQEIEGDPFSPTLNHPVYGPIWDFTTDQPLTHGGTPANCRCQLEAYATIHWSQVESIANLANQFKITIEDERIILPSLTIAELRGQLMALKDEIAELDISYKQVRQIETIFMRTLDMVEHATGSRDIRQATIAVQRLITIVRMAQFTMHAFQLASGPIGWAFALSGLAMTAISAAEMMDVNAH